MMSAFLQSEEWERIQRLSGRQTRRISDALVVIHRTVLGFSYYYCPRPVFRDVAHTSSFFSEARALAARDGVAFLKVDPLEEFDRGEYFLTGSYALQPRETTILDIRAGGRELLQNMHAKTRYNIRVAERHGVTVRRAEPPVSNEDLGRFWILLQRTAIRDAFRTHPEPYFAFLLGEQSGSFSNELFFAEYRGEAVAAGVINFYKKPRVGGAVVATYLHGASSYEHRSMMGATMLHWGVILHARTLGAASYDFWGIDRRRWPGLTRFKLGFGGAVASYPESVDAVFRPIAYRCYTVARRFRRS